MAKKNFKTGFDKLLGEPSEKETKSSSTLPKVLKEETRATFIVNKELLIKLKSISFWERKRIKSVVNDAFKIFIATYEKKNGTVQIPDNY